MSSFHKIPWEVAYEIISQAADERCLRRTILPVVMKNANSFAKHLCQVSKVWRSAAFAFMFQHYHISFPKFNGFMRTKFDMWPHSTCPDYAYEHVRTVSITVKAQAVASGCVLSTLHGYFDKVQLFPKVTSVKLEISGPVDNVNDVLDSIENNITGFLNFITSKFPRTKDIKVVYNYYNAVYISAGDYIVGAMLAKLLNSAVNAELELSEDFDFSMVNLTTIANLTSLDVTWGSTSTEIAGVIHHYASQLEKLKIMYYSFDMQELLFHNGESAIKYPRLQELVLVPRWSKYNDSWQLTTKETLFPSLRRLHLGINYPFSDDTLFRGNADTLEYLHIISTINVFEMLLRLGVFTKVKYTKLYHLSMDVYKSSSLDRDTAVPLPYKFIGCFHSTLQRFNYIEASFRDVILLPSFKDKHVFSSTIRIINFGEIMLEMSEIFALLNKQPLLASLTCEYKHTDGDCINLSRITELVSIYYPLSTAFWHWKTKRSFKDMSVRSTEFTALLAILCPNFTYIEFDMTSRLGFNNLMLQLMLRNPFKGYSNQIRRVLYKESVASSIISNEDSGNGSDSDIETGSSTGPEFNDDPQAEPEWSLFA